MARKPAPGFKVERFTMGKWLWVIMPNFKTEADAQAWIDQNKKKEPEATYRVVGA